MDRDDEDPLRWMDSLVAAHADLRAAMEKERAAYGRMLFFVGLTIGYAAPMFCRWMGWLP